MFFLALGIGFAFFLRHTYHTGEGIDDRAIFLTPFLILYGLMVTVQPAMFIPKGSFRQAPMIYKMMNIIVGVVGIGLGIYLRAVVFANWK
jgi:hypothetical protein